MTDEKKPPVEGLEGAKIEDVPISLESLRVAAGSDGKVWCFLNVGNDTWHGVGLPLEVALPFCEALMSTIVMMAAPGLKEEMADILATTPSNRRMDN